MPNVTVTNSTLVNTCNFPSVRFGFAYTSQIANDVPVRTAAGETITHPAPSNYTVTPAIRDSEAKWVASQNEQVANNVVQGLPSVASEATTAAGATVTSNAGGNRTNVNVTNTSAGATVASTFGGVASDQNVTRTAAGATVTGKQCP